MNRRGYFLTLDAFLTLVLVLGLLFFVKPYSSQVSHEVFLQGDLLSVLSSVKIGEINNSYVKSLISNGSITNLNQSVLEQIGEFYSSSSSFTTPLVNSVINDIGMSDNVGLYFNNMPIYSSGDLDFDDAYDVWVSRQIISGIQQGNSSRGYSSRAFLYSNNKVDYFYFGGYVGDGNITLNLGDDVEDVNIEAVFSADFDLYINDVFTQSYSPTMNVPFDIDLDSYSYLFSTGENKLEFRSEDDLYIAGGYVRVVYNSSDVLSSNKTYNLPGIEGVINFYDSFYVPGTLNSMKIFLHYNSPYNIFMNIGNQEIYSGNSSGVDTEVTLNNAYLSGLLDYSDLDFETIPLRLGLENVSYLSNFSMDADVVSVTDLSGSMAPSCSGSGFSFNICCFFSSDYCGSISTCQGCGGTFEDKIDLAKQANNAFIDSILNKSGNRAGLVGYKDKVYASDTHTLSNNNVSLKNKVNSWTAGSSTCICCGINRAVQELVANSSSDKYRSIVVMSDGEANVACAQQGTGNAKQDAINAACDAYNDYGIIVYAIGFGSDADESTLQDIASCGMGNYYYGDVSELVDVYGQVADDILDASYFEQTVISEGIYTKLYPDSYISIDYEKDIFNNNISTGTFFIPNDTEPYEVKVLSYSGSKWTDKVQVYNSTTGNWNSFFDMSVYNSTFVNLGDPYVVNVPLQKLVYGNNSVRVFVGLNSLNLTYGSPYNKVIYSLVSEISSYSPIVASAKGCNWIIEFDDGTNSTFIFPPSYSGTDQCFFTSSVISYNNNDAIDNAIYNLLSDMDLNSNNKVDVKFSENDLTVNSVEVEGIPFTWETEVQARAWR
jgi:hypothetical protein